MAALFAASRGADTRLIERTSDGGRKILISGGGRCNILPSHVDESRFVTDSSRHTLRHMLRSWPLREQIAFFETDLQLPLVAEAETGKLFPQSQRARDVRDGLLACARRKGVQILTNTLVTRIVPDGPGWIVEREAGDPLGADAVILATGGLSVPRTGSDGRGLEMARQLGHAIHSTYPALTPLRSTRTTGPFGKLPGVSLRVTITARSDTESAQATGGFLFTHDGYSGPAVLDISHVAVRSLSDTNQPATITVQWSVLDDHGWEDALRARASRTVLAAIGAVLPYRFAEALITTAAIEPHRQLSQLTRGERLRLIQLLVRAPLQWTGHDGYKKAEVTGGGIALGEIDPRTLESRRHRGLFLCGEMLDAFGPIGGYNFLWAWATGRAAGLGAAR